MSQRHQEAWLLRLALPDWSAAPEWPPLSAAEFAQLGEMARRHGVLPAVVMNAARWTRHDLTAARKLLVSLTGFSMMLRLRLPPVLQALREQGVQAVVLRGPEFADRLYPRPELRLFTDLDILVPRTALPSVGDAMSRLGYRLQNLPHLKHHAPYGEQLWKHPDHGQEQVEIHWNLVNSPALQRGVSVEIHDLQFDRDGKLTPASLLLIAAVHGATSHGFDRLQILCDIRQIARQTVDEDYLVDVGRRTGSAVAVATGLRLAEETFQDEPCRRLRRRVGGEKWCGLLTPRVVLRSDRPIPKLRRQLFRQLLKRR